MAGDGQTPGPATPSPGSRAHASSAGVCENATWRHVNKGGPRRAPHIPAAGQTASARAARVAAPASVSVPAQRASHKQRLPLAPSTAQTKRTPGVQVHLAVAMIALAGANKWAQCAPNYSAECDCSWHWCQVLTRPVPACAPVAAPAAAPRRRPQAPPRPRAPASSTRAAPATAATAASPRQRQRPRLSPDPRWPPCGARGRGGG